MRPKDTDAPPEKLKRKWLHVTPDADDDGDGRTGVTLCPFHHSSNDGCMIKWAYQVSP